MSALAAVICLALSVPSPTPICSAGIFDVDTSGFMVNNLFDAPAITDPQTCMQTCCDGQSSEHCVVWQFDMSLSTRNPCQLGNPDPSGGKGWTFDQSADWAGGARSAKGAILPMFPTPTMEEKFSGFAAGKSCSDSPAGEKRCGYLSAERCRECCESYSALGCCVHDTDGTTIKSTCSFYESSVIISGAPNLSAGIIGAGSGGGGGGGCGGGCIFIILVFTLPVVYLAVGSLYNFKAKERRGIEMIPNIEFWKDLPKLEKDGIIFLWRSLRRLCGGSYSSV